MNARLGVALAAAWLAGCAAIPWPRAAWTPAPAGTGLQDLRGVVHVHTAASHDSPGRFEDVVAAARAAGVRWVALTEHTRPGRQGPHGEIDGVLMLPGFELSVLGGSLLALGVAEAPPASKDAAALVRWTHAAGGAAVLGHLERSRLTAPEAWRAAQPDAVEVVNLHANTASRRGALAWRVPLLPGALALGALVFLPPENLARWEALPGPPPVVGAADAHAKFRALGPLGGTVDRYRDVFRLVTTHVLAPDAKPGSILAALRAGRSYVALEGLARVDTFRFEPRAGGAFVAAPRAAHLRLVCDGHLAAEAEAREAWLAAPAGAARCRAEAWLGERLWVLTSPRVLPMQRP